MHMTSRLKMQKEARVRMNGDLWDKFHLWLALTPRYFYARTIACFWNGNTCCASEAILSLAIRLKQVGGGGYPSSWGNFSDVPFPKLTCAQGGAGLCSAYYCLDPLHHIVRGLNINATLKNQVEPAYCRIPVQCKWDHIIKG